MNMTSLVPAASRKAMFQNPANVQTPAFNILSLGGARPVVRAVTTGLTERARSVGLVNWFEQRNCQVIESNPDNVADANVVIITKPRKDDTSEQAHEYQKVWERAQSGTIFIHPLANGLLQGVFNFTHFMSEQAMDIKTRAVRECKSQIDRTGFDQVQKDAARANALYAMINAGGIHHYAELFKMALVQPDGSVVDNPLRSIYCLPKTGKAVCLSPHPDDYPIAVGGVGNSLAGKGWSVLDLVFTTSPRGVTNEFVEKNYPHIVSTFPAEEQPRAIQMALLKEGIRMGETGKADALLGTTCRPLGFNFWNRKKDNGSLDVHYSETMAAMAMIDALTEGEGELDLLAMPMEGDMHPAHIATHNMGMEIARIIARDRGKSILTAGYVSPWYNGGIDINAFNYYNPGNNFLLDCRAAYHAERALAEAGRELTVGFAAKPLAMSYYCEGKYPIAEGFNIAVKE